MRSTTSVTGMRTRRNLKLLAEKPTRIMPPRRAKSKTSSEGSYQESSVQGMKRQNRRTSDRSPKIQKRRNIGVGTSEIEASYVPSIHDLFKEAPIDETFTIEDLLPDLTISYVGHFEPPPSPPRPKRKAWPQQPIGAPLTDPDKLPSGWSENEPDLDHNDIDAQIERCKVRLQENIMPHFFEIRLEQLRMTQAKRNALAASEPGDYSWAVLQRLEWLRSLEFELQSIDRFNQVPNVQALLWAYRQGRLNWNIGMVTYWSKGVQLCEPRPFYWDEYEVLSDHHAGQTGFWMEGLIGPGPRRTRAVVRLPSSGGPPIGEMGRSYEIAIRLAGTRWWSEMRFVHDSGADIMTIYEGDIPFLMGRSRTEPRCMGMTNAHFANNSRASVPVIQVEVTILDPTSRRRLTKWTKIQCQILSGYCDGVNHCRLDGPWLRYMLYNASAPSTNDLLLVSNTHNDIMQALPDTDHLRARPPPRYRLHPPTRTTLNPSQPLAKGAAREYPAPVLIHDNMPKMVP